MSDEWQGDNPFYLIIQYESAATVIDLDEPQWATKHADLMRAAPAAWLLNVKENLHNVAIILVHPGEQPYYTARHVGIAFGGSGEVTAYGLGKKRLDGHVDRIWVLPNGSVCTGDDVEPLALVLIRNTVPAAVDEALRTGDIRGKEEEA